MAAGRVYLKFRPLNLQKVCEYLKGKHKLSYFVDNDVVAIDGNEPMEFIELGMFIQRLKTENGTVRDTG